MASAAFKSTRRSLHGASSSSDRSDQRPCPRRSRSRFRSVSAAPRGRGVEGDYANTCTNPLFDSTAATSSGGGDAARRERDRGREPVKVGGRGGGGGGGRARSVSVAPQGRRTGGAAAVGGRRSSRARSVTPRPTQNPGGNCSHGRRGIRLWRTSKSMQTVHLKGQQLKLYVNGLVEFDLTMIAAARILN